MTSSEQETIYDPAAKRAAKLISLIAACLVAFSALHQWLEWSVFDTDNVGLMFKSGLVLMLVALAFNGKATTKNSCQE